MSEHSPAPARVAVIGGGISGLAAAWRLAGGSPPVQVILLEQSGDVGGKLRLGTVGGLTVDLGAEALLARRPEATALIGDLGLAGDLVHPRTSAASVWHAGRAHPLPAGTVMGVPGDPDRLRGLLSVAEVARVAAEPDLPAPPLAQDVDVASWVTARFGPAVLDRLVEPLLGGVYAGHADRLSLQATLPQLWPAAREGGSVLRAVARATGTAGGSGSPAGTRAGGEAEPVFAGLAGGVGRLPLRLAERLRALGGQVRTGVTVRELRRTGTGWRVISGAVGSEQALDVDAVLVAVPAAAASRLLAAECSPAAARLAEVPAASMAVVAAAVPRAVTAGLAGSGLLVPPAEGGSVKAVTFSSSKWAWVDAQDPELVVVRASVGRHGEEAVLHRDDAELAELALAELAQLLGRPVPAVACTVTRWGGALPQYLVGHVDRIAAVREAVAATPGLAVCGASFDGLGVPACIAAAEAAAARIAGFLAGRDAARAQSGPGEGAGAEAAGVDGVRAEAARAEAARVHGARAEGARPAPAGPG